MINQECPLSPNQLVTLLEEKGQVIEERLDVTGLCRVVFVSDENPEAGLTEIASILDQIGSRHPLPMAWFLAWQVSGYRPTRTKWLLSKRRREGWLIDTDKVIAIARKAVPTPIQTFYPPNYSWRDEGGCVILIGPIPASEDFLAPPFDVSFRYLADKRRFFPTRPFLNKLAVHQLAVAYLEKDQRRRDSLVMIGAHQVIQEAIELNSKA